MKKLTLCVLLLLVAMTVCSRKAEDDALMAQLKALPHVSSVTKTNLKDFPMGSYLLTFRQPVNHYDPKAGYFDQRVLLSIQNPDSLSLIITNGYFLPPFDRSAYRNELSEYFGANQVSVEHRYCGESVPEGDSLWTWNNAEQAAADQHVITQSLKHIFHRRWMTTGASKSGYTTVLYRYFYPEDVDVSVPFVAPFTIGLHDPDVQRYLETQSGDPLSRAAVHSFVRRALRSMDALLPRYTELMDEKEATPFMHGSVKDYFANDIMDHTVGLWMYEDPKKFVPLLPSSSSTDDEVWNYLSTRLEGVYFDPHDRFAPYMVQASRELGLYDFDFSAYADLCQPRVHGMCGCFFTDEMLQDHPYSDTLFRHVLDDFLPKTQSHILFIYGQDDPWSGDAISDSICTENVRKYVIPGNHGTEILHDATPAQRDEIMGTLHHWLYD